MSSPLLGKAFDSTPTPVKAVLAVATGGSIIGAIVAFWNSPARWVVIIGIAVVVFALLAYRLILKFLEKRKANPLTQRISQNSAAAPQAISEPAKRARLDDLRKNFETGVEKFRAAGKNLYAVPWYLLVGEPGSGKTEAIRHCNVGFPPGLQDQLQGAGGTLNMNWWFTNHAVILDTAGRLMFEEAPPGQTTEWQEFLKLLRTSRPNCPVNGMLLVIPCDSLIRDTADVIERKAGKIAQQLDQIQRALGVRFPVFVVVTKCDLINGFREFFDDLDDPRLQHQILGWSNPASLDEQFHPEQVEEHLSQVRHRMMRRRMVMLQDPVHTEDPSKRRIDQIDALYAFPDSLTQVAPRLRRYLEMIFVAGEWSSKPLFLRGIYMTSSMREGSALDAELADALGVSVESLPEGRAWERDRAFFLRDLFMSKIFKEKGLVTRAGNVLSAQRRRRAIVLGALCGTILLVAGLGLLGVFAFRSSVGKQQDFWAAAGELMKQPNGRDYFEMVEAKGHFNGAVKLDKVPGSPTLVAFLEQAVENAEKNKLRAPPPFNLIPGLTRNIGEGRRETIRTLVECCVLRPAVARVRGEVLAKSDPRNPAWNSQVTGGLASMIRLNTLVGLPPGDPRRPKGDEIVSVKELYEMAIAPAELSPQDDRFKHIPGLLTRLQALLDNSYLRDQWALSANAIGDAPSHENAVITSVNRFVEYWGSPTSSVPRLAHATALQAALVDYQAAEAKLLALEGDKFPPELERHESFANEWQLAYSQLDNAAGRADTALKALSWPDSVDTLAKAVRDEVSTIAGQELNRLLVQARPASEATPAGAASGIRQKLEDAKAALEANIAMRVGDLTKTLGSLPYEKYAKKPGEAPEALLHIRRKLYAAADKALPRAVPPAPWEPGKVSEALDAADAAIADVKKAGEAALSAAKDDSLREWSQRASEYAAGIGQRMVASRCVQTLVAATGTLQDRVRTMVEQRGGDRARPPRVPLSRFEETDQAYSPEFDRQAAALVVKDWIRAAKLMDDKAVPGGEAQAQPFKTGWFSCADFAIKYVEYWSETVPSDMGTVQGRAWDDFYKRMTGATVFTINNLLEELLARVEESLTDMQTVIAAYPSKSQDDLAKVVAIKDKLKRAVDERKQLAAMSDQCKVVMTRWLELGPDWIAARNTIAGLTPVALRSDYLPIYNPDSGVRYWNSFCLKALGSLGKQSLDAGKDSLSKIQAAYAHYPLTREGDDKQALTPQQVSDAAKMLASFAATDAQAGAAKTIGEGKVTEQRIETIDSELRKISGVAVFTSEAQRKWAASLAAVAAFLNRPQPCEIVTLDPRKAESVPDRISAYPSYQRFSVASGSTSASPHVVFDIGTEISIRTPGDAVEFKMLQTDQTATALTQTLSAPWNVVRLLLDPNAKAESADGKKWTVTTPLLLEGPGADGAPTRFYYWISIRFESKVPDLKTWPAPTP